MCAVALKENREEMDGLPDLIDQGRLDKRYYNVDGSRKDADDQGVPIDWDGLDDELTAQGKNSKLYNPDGSRKDKGPDGVLIDWENVEREEAMKRRLDEQNERRVAIDGQIRVAQENIDSLNSRINFVQAELNRRQVGQLSQGVLDMQIKVLRERLLALQKDREGWVYYRDSFASQEVGKKL